MSYFTKEQLLTMLQLQKEANDVMSDAWLTSVNGCPSEGAISYYRAAAVESYEAIGHLGFKWWKKETPDEEQTNLELIDIIHFALSDFYRLNQFQLNQELDSLLETEDIYEVIPCNSIEDKRQSLEDFASQCTYDREASLINSIALCMRFGLTANYVYNMYVGKNVLNKFRTANGQRQNTYIKIWNTSGEEDNVYLEKYLTALNGELIDAVELEKYLSQQYSNVLMYGVLKSGQA
jgi:hypothetical protein